MSGHLAILTVTVLPLFLFPEMDFWMNLLMGLALHVQAHYKYNLWNPDAELTGGGRKQGVAASNFPAVGEKIRGALSLRAAVANQVTVERIVPLLTLMAEP